MTFLVFQCHACVDVSLQLAQSLRNGSGSCPSCNAPTTVITSTFYGWGDRIHFDELRHSVRDSRLSTTDAIVMLERIRSAAKDEAGLRNELRAAARHVRSVTLIRAVQVEDAQQLHHLTGMLLIILGALVSACGRDG